MKVMWMKLVEMFVFMVAIWFSWNQIVTIVECIANKTQPEDMYHARAIVVVLLWGVLYFLN